MKYQPRQEAADDSLAAKIIQKLQKSLAPDACTWGEQWEEAWRELFIAYKDDMIADVASILDEKNNSK